MKIGVLSIFPGIFSGFFSSSLIEKAQTKGLLSFILSDIRDFADPPHYAVDDVPYGGGAGMVMKAEPICRAIEAARKELPRARVVLLSAGGQRFSQAHAARLSTQEELILVCGRYEGVDQRAIDLAVDEEISIGDYVLMGGEVAAMVVIEAVTRLIPSVLGNAESLACESFDSKDGALLLEAPHYTRPADFRGHAVPEVLLSGDHRKIETWRKDQAVARTRERRPDLHDAATTSKTAVEQGPS